MNNLTMFCSVNVCQNNGKCLLLVNNTTTTPFCLCNKCYTGDRCEIEKYSKNLWIYGISEEINKSYNPYDGRIILVSFCIFGIISFVSNLLSLQTFLFSKKIRITNLGIYLIFYSLTGLIITVVQSVNIFMNLAFNFKEGAELNHLIQCGFMCISINLGHICLQWFWLYIAVERVLIEYSFVSLYDSRQRSFISSTLLYVLLPISNTLLVLFGRKTNSYNSYDSHLFNFTPIGYTCYLIFGYINYIVSPLSFIIACVFIFKHLIERRRRVVNNESFYSSLVLIASKHYDFFLPPLMYTILISPYFILDKLMNCLRADSITVLRAEIVTRLLSNSVLAFTFFIYVYLSKVYYGEFWQTSPFGRFLIYVIKRFTNFCKHEIIVVEGECRS